MGATKTETVVKYPTQMMKGRQMYKGLCVGLLFFGLLTIHTLGNYGNGYQGKQGTKLVPAKGTGKLNRSLWHHAGDGYYAGRGLKSYYPETWEDEEEECEGVHDKNGKEEQCDFVKATEDCGNDEGLLEYNQFIYCTVGGSLVPLAVVILVLWWLFCFCGLAVCADDYFCPSLVVISKTLHLSPNVAGVTFLAFGNGAPDVFSALAALDSGGDPGLGLGGLLGAGMFVTTVVCGTIAIITPFKAMQRPFLRDVIFYLFGIYWTFFILWKGFIYLWEAIGFIIFWVFYVIIVIASGSIYKRQQASQKDQGDGVNNITLTEAKKLDEQLQTVVQVAGMPNLSVSPTTVSLDNIAGSGFDNPAFTGPDLTNAAERRRQFERRTTLDEIVMKNETGKDLKSMDSITEGEEEESTDKKDGELGVVNFSLDSDAPMDSKPDQIDTKYSNGKVPDDEKMEGYDDEDEEEVTHLRAFLDQLNPINVEEWPEMRWWARIFEVFKCPIVMLINLSCPVVNYEEEETWNWNKHVFVLQMFISPTVFVLCLQLALTNIGGVFPVYGLTLILGAVMGAVVWFTSVTHQKPKYIEAFGWLGFFIALAWIYVIANEVVAVLQSIGLVLKISTGILGLTLLAWGNSIGDWIADTVMARQGFARMGFAACFGGPFFNLCLGFGIPMIASMARTGENSRPLAMTPVNLMLTGFLMVGLLISLIYLTFRQFNVNRPYGLILLVFYVVFLVIALLAETGVIMKGWKPS